MRTRTIVFRLFTAVLLSAGCTPASPPGVDRPVTGQPPAQTPPPPRDPEVKPTAPEGAALFQRLAGLWAGPATMTRLGDFPHVNMDFRPASDHVLFARVDLDAQNALRFAFSVETLGGKDVLVFRNGGLFQGRSRDTRTVLVEVDEAQGTYRFCGAEGGCEYVESKFRFTSETRLVLDVTVRGQMHEHWEATRTQPRTLPVPFPADWTSQGEGTAPFPPMPRLTAEVSWARPLSGEADVWLLLSQGPCTADSGCFSRWISAVAPAGATSAQVALDQLHAGDYAVTVLLDRDRNLGATFAPSSGDGVSMPNQPLSVPRGEDSKASFSIVHSLP